MFRIFKGVNNSRVQPRSVRDISKLSDIGHQVSILRSIISDQKHEIMTGLVVLIFLLASFGIISAVPLNAKKNWITSSLRKDNININISGVVNFNVFLMKYVITDSEIIIGGNESCNSGVKIRVPKIYINPFTGSMALFNSTIIAVVGKNTGSIYNMISSRLNNNVKSVTIKDAALSVAMCDDIVIKSLDDMSYDYGNVRSKITTSLYIKQLDASTAGGKHTIGAILAGSEYTAKLKYVTDHTNILNLSIQSDPINVKIDVDRYKASKGESIGSYDISIPDLSNLYSIIGGNSEFLRNVSSKVKVDSSGPILYKHKVIESNSFINTSYGSGTLKVLIPDNSLPIVSLSFGKLSYNNKGAPTPQIGAQFDMMNIIWRWLMEVEHGFKLNIDEISGNINKVTNIGVEYKIENERFTPVSFGMKIPGGEISLYKEIKQASLGIAQTSGRSNISEINPIDDNSQGIQDVSVMLDVKGTDVVALSDIIQNIGSYGNLFVLQSDEKMRNTDYVGRVILSIGTGDQDVGISSFDIRFKNVKIGGSYVTHKYIDDRNQHQFVTKSGRLNFINVDFAKLFSKESLQLILKKIYITDNTDGSRSVVFNDMMTSSTLDPMMFDLNAQNCYINGSPINSLNMSSMRGEGYFMIKSFNVDSQLINGSGNVLVDIDNPSPLIKLNVRIFNVDTVKIQDVIDWIYSNQPANISHDEEFSIFINKKRNIPSLSQFSGDFSVQIMNLQHKILSVRNMWLIGKIVNGALHFDDISLAALGGNIRFSGIVDTTSTPRISLRLSGNDLSVSKILKAVANVNNVASGKVNIDRSGFDGSGFSIREIAGTLDGRMSVNVSNMKFNDFDVISLANTIVSTQKYTPFDAQAVLRNDTQLSFPTASGDIRIRNGVADTDGITMKTSGVSGILQFNVDLRTRMINNVDSRFIILARDPRKDSKYIELLLVGRVIGDLDNPQSRILLDQVNDYVRQMTVINEH